METMYARFDDYKMAEKAVGALLDHGADKDCISLISRANDKDDVLEHDSHAKEGITTTTGPDAAAGAAKGAGVGVVVGTVGALASLFIPGFGLVTGGGALATAIGAMAGTTAAGAFAGGVAGFLQDQGMDEEAARNYEKALERGGAIVSINFPCGKIDRIEVDKMLTKYGVVEVDGKMRHIA